jgi:hypothetical protein
MKKIIFTILIIFSSIGTCWASPFLVCDYDYNITKYKIIGLPAPLSNKMVITDYHKVYGLKFDLANLPVDNNHKGYVVTIKTYNNNKFIEKYKITIYTRTKEVNKKIIREWWLGSEQTPYNLIKEGEP